ncbi:MAG: primase protein [Candidatus Levybacteria bacterium GW2011_GWA2_40_8]|nr:MAG: primase protein [Candidatus Levybacteria bacterium GW2011_GWA2_40_8]
MDQAARVREKIDLVSLISEYLTLKKAGRNFTTLCPFHNEKTPSFVISPERQIWHCFGCGRGGDAFTFLMEYEKIEFLEALKILGKKVGIEIKTGDFAKSSKRQKIYELNKTALDFYHYILTKHRAGEKALDYLLKKRKLNKGLIESFGLGFAPSNNSLSRYLLGKKKSQRQDLLEAGLSFQSRGELVDFFRGRIIFPLTDTRGNILGFSGRGLLDSDTPKYINTKETIVYHKGSTFFGINKAISEIKEKEEAIIMEGEFDVISAFREGIKNAVAIKGTALTSEQSTFLSRICQKIILCLDQDEAGIEATKRSLSILEDTDLTSYVAKIPDNKDPDDALNKNPNQFKNNLKESIGAYDFLIEDSFLRFDPKTFDGKKKISDGVLPSIGRISNEVVKEHYLKKISTKLDTSIESLKRQIGKVERKEDKKPSSPAPAKKDRREVLEEYLLSLIVQSENPKELFELSYGILSDYKYKQEILNKISEKLSIYFKNNEDFESKNFVKNLPSELTESFDKIFLYPLPKFDEKEKFRKETESVSKELMRLFLKEKIKELSDKLRNAKEEKDPKKEETLRSEISKTTSLLSVV